MSTIKKITSTTDSSNFIVSTNSSDDNPNYLRNKLVAGDNITLSTITSGGELKVQIDASNAATALNDLSDVDTSASSTGDVLAKQSDGTFAFDTPVQNLGDLGDVDDTSTDGQILTSDGAGNFTFEDNDPYSPRTVSELTADTALTTSTLKTNHILRPISGSIQIELPAREDIFGKEITFTLSDPTYTAQSESLRYAYITSELSEIGTILWHENNASSQGIYLTVVGESVTVVVREGFYEVVSRSYPVNGDILTSVGNSETYFWRNKTECQLEVEASPFNNTLTVVTPNPTVWRQKPLVVNVKATFFSGDDFFTLDIKDNTETFTYYTYVFEMFGAGVSERNTYFQAKFLDLPNSTTPIITVTIIDTPTA